MNYYYLYVLLVNLVAGQEPMQDAPPSEACSHYSTAFSLPGRFCRGRSPRMLGLRTFCRTRKTGVDTSRRPVLKARGSQLCTSSPIHGQRLALPSPL